VPRARQKQGAVLPFAPQGFALWRERLFCCARRNAIHKKKCRLTAYASLASESTCLPCFVRPFS